MKESFNPNLLSQEDKKRMAHIEGRSDLFETKIIELTTENIDKSTNEGKLDNMHKDNKDNILLVSRGPGSGKTLLPVAHELINENNIELQVLTDGMGQKIITDEFNSKDITPERSVLDSAQFIDRSDIIITSSSTDERGLEVFTSGTFEEKTTILIEDYYTSSHGYLQRLIESDFSLPEKICVIDEIAKKLLIEKFPDIQDLKNRIEITGQPAFDRFTQKNSTEISKKIRQKLDLQDSDKLITFMSTFIPPESVQKIIESMSNLGENIYIAFRKHPRDNTEYSEYEKLFHKYGLNLVNTDNISSDDIMTASDLIMTTWSTAGLEAIYKDKPTIHLSDEKVLDYPELLPNPMPPVSLGASVGIDNLDDLSEATKDLLDPNSERSKNVKKNMKKFYPADGKNSKRVVDVINKSLSKN